MPALAITGSGMVSAVGLNAPASCAAIRCAVDNFRETRFMDAGGEWIIGSEVPLEEPWRGPAKLVKMLTSVLRECAETDPDVKLDQVPLLLCLAEDERPGRPDRLGPRVFYETEAELGIHFHPKSELIAQGRVGVVVALHRARQLIVKERVPRVLIAGVDSLLSAPTLRVYEEREQLLTSQNSNGFIPGEAAAAIVIEPVRPSDEPQLLCLGVGTGVEKATRDSELPLRADGLVKAIRGALDQTGWTLGAVDFRITDVSGEQYAFKEAALALTRVLRERKEELDIWHPADCIGEIGAAAGPAMLAVLLAAMRKDYSPGPNVLCHLGNDDSKRAAAVLAYQPVRSA